MDWWSSGGHSGSNNPFIIRLYASRIGRKFSTTSFAVQTAFGWWGTVINYNLGFRLAMALYIAVPDI